MIRTILVALDASPRAPEVFAAANEIASRFEARMLLLRALDVPPEFPPAAHVSGGDALPAYLAKRAREDLEAIAAGNPHADLEHLVIVDGQPWRAILSAADRLDVDLIVLGSHGYDALDRLLGTTAGKVANLAHRSVLVVHPRPR